MTLETVTKKITTREESSHTRTIPSQSPLQRVEIKRALPRIEIEENFQDLNSDTTKVTSNRILELATYRISLKKTLEEYINEKIEQRHKLQAESRKENKKPFFTLFKNIISNLEQKIKDPLKTINEHIEDTRQSYEDTCNEYLKYSTPTEKYNPVKIEIKIGNDKENSFKICYRRKYTLAQLKGAPFTPDYKPPRIDRDKLIKIFQNS